MDSSYPRHEVSADSIKDEFHRFWVAQKTQNKQMMVKGSGGAVGLTENPSHSDGGWLQVQSWAIVPSCSSESPNTRGIWVDSAR